MGYLEVMRLNIKGSSPIIFQYLYTKEYGVKISKGSSSPWSNLQAKGLMFLFFSWFLIKNCIARAAVPIVHEVILMQDFLLF